MIRHVIIGNSGAALAAVTAIRERTCDPVTVVSAERCPAYSPLLLPYAVSGKIRHKDMFLCDRTFYDRNEIDTILGNAAVRVEPSARRVLLKNGQTVEYDRLLIATGSRTIVPPIPGSNVPGIYAAWTERDARTMKKALKEADRVAVVGAGLIGLRMADVIHQMGKRVTIIEVFDRVARTMLNLEVSTILRRTIEKAGIRLLLGTKLANIKEDGREKVLSFDSAKAIKVDMIIMAAGVAPNSAIVKDSGIKVRQGIIVDDCCRTSAPDVYAAGDVAEAPDPATGEHQLNPTWINAVLQGRAAGINMTGAKVPTSRRVRLNVVNLMGVTIASAGIVREGDRYTNRVHRSGDCYRSLYFDGDRLVGALLVGDVGDAGILGHMIERQACYPDRMATYLPLNAHSQFYASTAREPVLMDTKGRKFSTPSV